MCSRSLRTVFVNDHEVEALTRAADALLARGRVVEADRAVVALERLRAIRLDQSQQSTCRCEANA